MKRVDTKFAVPEPPKKRKEDAGKKDPTLRTKRRPEIPDLGERKILLEVDWYPTVTDRLRHKLEKLKLDCCAMTRVVGEMGQLMEDLTKSGYALVSNEIETKGWLVLEKSKAGLPTRVISVLFNKSSYTLVIEDRNQASVNLRGLRMKGATMDALRPVIAGKDGNFRLLQSQMEIQRETEQIVCGLQKLIPAFDGTFVQCIDPSMADHSQILDFEYQDSDDLDFVFTVSFSSDDGYKTMLGIFGKEIWFQEKDVNTFRDIILESIAKAKADEYEGDEDSKAYLSPGEMEEC